MELPQFEVILRPIKNYMWITGIPYNSKVQFRLYIYIIAVAITLAEEIAFFYTNYAPENFLRLTQLAPCVNCGVLAILKIIPIAIKRQKIFDLTQRLEELYSTILAHSKKIAVVKKQVIFVKIFVKYFYILNWVLISTYNFSSLIFMLYNYLKEKKVVKCLPYSVIIPFSIESWPSWFYVYMHSIASGK